LRHVGELPPPSLLSSKQDGEIVPAAGSAPKRRSQTDRRGPETPPSHDPARGDERGHREAGRSLRVSAS